MRAAFRRHIFSSYLPSIAPGRALIDAYIAGSSYAEAILEFWRPARSMQVVLRSEAELASALEWDQVPRLYCKPRVNPRATRLRDCARPRFDPNSGRVHLHTTPEIIPSDDDHMGRMYSSRLSLKDLGF